MFSIVSTIRDKAGINWVVTQTWVYNDFFCVALINDTGQLGGARFRSGDSIIIRR